MVEAWRSGGYVTYPELPGWSGPPWSLPLVPGWRELAGKVLAEIVVEQWIVITAVLLDDLEVPAPERWCVADLSGPSRRPPPRRSSGSAPSSRSRPARMSSLPLRALRDEPAIAGEGRRRSTDACRRSCRRTKEPRSGRATAGQACEACHDRPRRAADSPAAQRLHAELPAAARAARQLAAGLHLPDRQADLRPPRPRHSQHPLPRLQPTDGARGGAGTDRDRHPGRGLDYRNFPAVAPKLEPAGQARRLLSAAQPPLHRRHPHPRDRLRQASCGSSPRASPAWRRWTRSTASCRAGRRPSSPAGPEDRCHLNGLGVVGDRCATSPPWARPTSPAAGARTRLRRRPDRRRLGRDRAGRALDAPLAALARRAPLAARVRQRHSLGRRPRRRHRRRSPSCPASPAASPSPATSPSSASPRSARPPPSAACR